MLKTFWTTKIKYALDDLLQPPGVLVDWQIHRWASKGGIDPYDPALVNPCSVNVRLSGIYLIPHYVDAQGTTEWERREVEEFWLCPGQFVLTSTLETFDFTGHVAQLLLKSTPAREGLNHALAGWVDYGFGHHRRRVSGPVLRRPTLTLEMWSAYQPLPLVAGQPIAQLVISRTPWKPNRDYSQTGRYNQQVEPQGAIK